MADIEDIEGSCSFTEQMHFNKSQYYRLSKHFGIWNLLIIFEIFEFILFNYVEKLTFFTYI